MMRIACSRLVLALVCLSCACVGPDVARLTFTVRHLPTQDRLGLLDTAETALVKLGYRIRSRDAAAGVLMTEPTDLASTDRRSTRMGSPVRMRRLVEVRVTSTDSATSVYCKAIVQELVTEAHRLFALDRDGIDRPARTPIDREAATTREQNAVWRTIRRDRSTERAILSAILDGTGGSTG